MNGADTLATIKAVVVDDEQLAREELCYLLGRVGGVEVVGQAAAQSGARSSTSVVKSPPAADPPASPVSTPAKRLVRSASSA